MNGHNKYLNILFPVYNEHLRLENGIRMTVAYMDKLLQEKYQITIIDNGSVDDTPSIAKKLCQEFDQVRYKRLHKKGVGIAFRAGIADNDCPVVGYMDVDLSTDIKHLKDMIQIFRTDDSVGMVNASRWNRKSDAHGRKWYRNITSGGLTLLLKISLGMKASDSICGFKFFRKEIAEQLIQEAGADENGWFYMIELLLRAERNHIHIYELPVRWQDDYHSKVKVFQLIRNYCIQILKLRKKFRKEKGVYRL